MKPTVYERLGLDPVINANTTLSRLGGSLVPDAVGHAMLEASRSFVDVEALDLAVGRRIAELTRNEAAVVTAGAAAGLTLAVLAAAAGEDPELIELALAEGPAALPRREVVVQRCQANPYVPALTLGGGRIRWIGEPKRTRPADLERALGPATVAIVWFAGAHLADGDLGLEALLERGAARSIPVVVDAAAQIPPTENLWRLTGQGASAAVFSGGKGLRGPGSTGLVVGRRAFIDAIRAHASPRQRSGRALKVAKEEYVGLLVAVEERLALDEAAERARIEDATEEWRARLSRLPGVRAWREFPGEAGRPLPRLVVDLTQAGVSSAEAAKRLRQGRSHAAGIDVAVRDEATIYLNAELLEPGEELTVAERLLELVADLSGGTRGR